MLSLPLIPPQGDILRTTFQPRSSSLPARSNGADHAPHRQPRHDNPSSSRSHASNNTPSPLALLKADEDIILARKSAIRNFGASWIRPPGVPKTLQAQREEEAEMADQEEMARREQDLRDMQAQQEVEEARRRAQEAGEGGAEGDTAVVERDLDDDIPDADADADGEAEGEQTDATFNDDSMLEGSRVAVDVDQEQYAALEEAELTGAARDEEELGIPHEINLDDSIPEAGSYQHTDTEEEDSTSEEEDEDDEERSSEANNSFAAQSARRRGAARAIPGQSPQPRAGPSLRTGLQERLRAQAGSSADALARSPGTLNLSSSLLESSFVANSSPVTQRGRGGRSRGRRS